MISTSQPGSSTPARRGNVFSRLLPATFDEAVRASFFAMLVAAACMMPMQNDSWWNLRAGQEWWQNRSLSLPEDFSFTAAGPWPNHEWLSQLVFYAVYSIGGLPGLTLFAASIVTLAMALAWRLMDGPASLRALLLGIAAASIAQVWTVRPHIFTLLGLTLLVWLIKRERYWTIPPLVVVWANLHGGVALGIVLLGVAAAGNLLLRGRTVARPLLLVAVASFIGTWFTPRGPMLWLRIPESLQRSAVNRIVEWMPPTLAESGYLPFWIVAAALIATAIHHRKLLVRDYWALTQYGMALVLLLLAVRSRRNVAPFLLIAAPALSQTLVRWMDTRPIARQRPTLSARIFFIGVTVGLTSWVALAWSRRDERLNWDPVPPAVVKAVESCGDRVFNSYTDGGYLIWFTPDVRVFIDSRQDPYEIEFVQEYVRAEQTGNYRAIFDRYGIRCSALPRTSRIAARLKADGWRTLADEGRWIVQGAAY